MLTTGLVGDVVGAGLAAIVSRWPYLRESLGEAGIEYAGAADLVELLETLSTDTLARAAAASVARRDAVDWRCLAPRLLDAILAVGAIKC